MIVTVLTSATGELLASLADIKDALELTDNVQDRTLERFARRASRQIERYLGRTLGRQKYEAVAEAYGGVVLQLPAYPVRHVFRVFDGTDTGSATELTSTEYRLDAARGQLNRDEGFPWTWQRHEGIAFEPEPGLEAKGWLVEFSAGYILPDGASTTWDGTTATGPTLDADVSDACIELVRQMYLSRDRDPNVQSERVGDLSITYGAGAGALPPTVLDLLAPLRSVI